MDCGRFPRAARYAPRSVISIGALSAAAIAHILVMVDCMGCVIFEDVTRQVMFRTGSEMVGNLMLLAAMSLHARYVLLDAKGLLPIKERPAKGETERRS